MWPSPLPFSNSNEKKVLFVLHKARDAVTSVPGELCQDGMYSENSKRVLVARTVLA